MSRTALVPQSPLGPFALIPVAANSLDFTFAVANAVDGNSFPSTGKEVLLVQNSDTNPHTFTVSSVADAKGRLGDITTYSLSAAEFGAYAFIGSDMSGWKQTDGSIYLSVSDATVKFAVLRLP